MSFMRLTLTPYGPTNILFSKDAPLQIMGMGEKR